jgi:hypothetical protein
MNVKTEYQTYNKIVIWERGVPQNLLLIETYVYHVMGYPMTVGAL